MSNFGDPLNPYEFRYRGLVFGAHTPVVPVDLRGLFDSAVRDGDRLIPRGDGALLGTHYSLPKEIIFDLRVKGALDEDGRPDQNYVDLVESVEVAFQRSTDEVFPLEFYFPKEGHQFINARVVNRVRPRRWSTELGLSPITVRLKAADPRFYGLEEKSVTANLYTTGGGGLDLPEVDFPHDFAVANNDAVAVNDGNAEAYPVVQFFGPLVGPTMTQVTLTNRTNGDVLQITQDVGVGQVLTADMAAAVDGSARTVIDLSGVTKYGSWDLPREPFRLSPGSNVLRFEATGDTDGVKAVVSFRDTSI